MALPLLWLGSAALGAILLADEREKRHQLTLNRRRGVAPKTLEECETAALSPSAWQTGNSKMKPQPGSIICCFVYGLIEHTGIWLDEHTLIELHGSGLVRAVSTKRFLAGRTGSKIFVACSHDHQVLVEPAMLAKAEQAIFTYREYDLFDNNCHRFVWSCLSGKEESLPSFNDLNKRLAIHFNQSLYWDEAELDI
jgi:hypothetical protein